MLKGRERPGDARRLGAGEHVAGADALAHLQLAVRADVGAARIGELDGKTYHGFEAVFSSDHGVTWDWEHRVILYRCPTQSPHSPQSVCLPDGRIVLAGEGNNFDSPDFGLARFLATGPQVGSVSASASEPW